MHVKMKKGAGVSCLRGTSLLFVRLRSAVANEEPGTLLVLYTKNRPASEMTWQVYTYVLRGVMYDLIAILFVLEMMMQRDKASER